MYNRASYNVLGEERLFSYCLFFFMLRIGTASPGEPYRRREILQGDCFILNESEKQRLASFSPSNLSFQVHHHNPSS